MADRDGDGIPDSIDKNPDKRDANTNANWQGVTNPGSGWTPDAAGASAGMVWVRDPRVTAGTMPGYSRMTASDAKKWYSYFPQSFPNEWKAMIDPLLRTGVVSDQKDALARIIDGVDWVALGLGEDAFDYLSISEPSAAAGSKTTTQAAQYTPQSIKGVGNNVWLQELGREMTDKEAKAMAKLFNSESKKSPSVYTSTTQTVGMAPEVFLQEQARAQEGYAERQVGVRFMDILDKFIANPTGAEKIAMEG